MKLPILELTFENLAGDPWEGQARVRFQGENCAPVDVREGLKRKQRDDIRWYIEEFMDLPEGGNATRAAQVEKELADFGKSLWDGLGGGPVHAWLGAVQVAGEGRLELRANTPGDEIAFRTPWELMRVGRDSSGGRLLHQLGVTVVRRVNCNLPRLHVPDTSDGLRVLAIVCRPDEAIFLDPRYTPEAILDALDQRPEVSVDFCRPGTLAALVDALERARHDGRPYHVVHFDGHGTTLPLEGGVGALCFENDAGGLDQVRATQLGDLLSRFNIPLVVLEACRTATKSFAQDTVAGALLREGVGTVLAMGHAVHVDMTRELMAAFYAGVARGWPLGQSLQAARNQLYAKPQRRTRIAADAPTIELRDWFVPQLYQSGDDPQLLRKKPPRRKRRELPALIGFPPEPRAGFQGRGYELHRLERMLIAHRAVLIHAPGGMGKTALAREAAHWWTRTGMFPDGAVFVSLEGNPSPERLVKMVGEALEGTEFHRRKNGAAWIEDQLARRRMLLVWDNYESVLPAFNASRPTPPEFADLARRWTAGASRLLVTCRVADAELAARVFPLVELNRIDGLMLLVGFLDRLGFTRHEREKRGWTGSDLEPIVIRVGGHPLALELLAAQIPRLGPQQVLAELSDLLARIEQGSPEGRNRSMWASLDFSIRHLSDAARAALPAVSLLAGGCPETIAADVVGLELDAWRDVRIELERTGLLSIADHFFRPHPVLGDLAVTSNRLVGPERETTGALVKSGHGQSRNSLLSVSPETHERFLDVVTRFAAEFYKLVRSTDARVALAVMAGTETVTRRAIDYAAASGRMEQALSLAEAMNVFLRMTGRGGEGAALIALIQQQMENTTSEISGVAAHLAYQSAWARAAEDPAMAAGELEELLARLRRVQSWDARFQYALTLMTVARVQYNFARRPAEAVEPLEQAISLFAELEKDVKISTIDRAVALGDLANAFMFLGRFDEALNAAEVALQLDQARQDVAAIAVSEGRIAQILGSHGRFAEAEERYRNALAAAEEAGDDETVAHLWQSLGILMVDQNRSDEAVGALQKALIGFNRAGDHHGEVRVLNWLGNAERDRGHREPAQAWYERSLELADRLKDIEGEAAARSGRAILWSKHAQDVVDPMKQQRLLNEAITEQRVVLALTRQLGQPVTLAVSHHILSCQLCQAGQLDEAEHHARQALAIRDRLHSPDTWKTLEILERIALARGETDSAAEYRFQKEAARTEAQQRAGRSPLPVHAVAALLQMALAAHAHNVVLADALASAGVDDPVQLLTSIETNDPWLATHMRALATQADRPAIDLPEQYAELVDAAWKAAVPNN